MPVLDLQVFRLTQKAINLINDPAPGAIVSSANVSGSIVQAYYGLVGGRLAVDNQLASTGIYDVTANQLYEGTYQYVQLLSTASASVVKGQLVYWYNRESYVVTTDTTATTASQVAGVILNGSWTKGNYSFIQVQGKASVLFKTSTTKSTPAIGDLVVADGSTSATVDVLADATSITSPIMKLAVGVAIDTAPVSTTLSHVDLRFIGQVY